MTVRRYEADPCHAVTGAVGAGYRSAVAALAAGTVLAVDGPFADWDLIATEICDALAAREVAVKQVDMREHFAAWPDIVTGGASRFSHHGAGRGGP
jgi:hypothetical protein